MYMSENLLDLDNIETVKQPVRQFDCDSISILLPNQPMFPEHAVNKQYVDEVIQNLKVDKAVLKFHDPKLRLPISPKVGERFISSGTGNGWIINHIYEYDGGNWNETNPMKGTTIWAQLEKETSFIFNGVTWDRFGKSIDHSDLKNIGKYTHKNIDEHINNERLHCKEKHISHDNIQNTGIYTHRNIDEHIMNTSDAHFGQDLTANGTPTFKSVRVYETSMATHVASKSYVDMIALGLKYIHFINKFHDPMAGLPTNCSNGDRFISLTSANKWKQNFIYEYDEKQQDDANRWKEYAPTSGTATYVDGGVIFAHDNIVFNGYEWIKFGSTQNHDSLFGAGTCPHEQLDEHIFNNTDAHFGQLLSSDGTPTFAQININGDASVKNITSRTCKTNFLQIGVEKLSQSIKDTSQFIITGNNDPLNFVRIYADASSTEPIKDIYMRARGDLNCPMELLKDTSIGSNIYVSHDGCSFNTVGTFECVTTEDHTTNAHGSSFVFGTTPNGAAEPRVSVTINHDGALLCKCSTDCTSLKSGAMVIDGGVAIGKELYIGGIMRPHNDIYFNSFDKISSIMNDTREKFDHSITNVCGGGGMSTYRGSKVTVSGVDSIMNGKIQLNAGIPHGSIEMYTGDIERVNINKSGNVLISNSDDVDCDSNAALVVNGGVHVEKNMYLGGNQIITNKADNTTIHPNSTLLLDTSSVAICGGGEADPERGGIIRVAGSNRKEDGGNVFISTGSIYGAKVKFATGSDSVVSLTSTNEGNWKFTRNVPSNSPHTGAVVIDGGLGADHISTNTIKCSNIIQLPLHEKEPPNGELGMMFYDTKNNTVRVFTNMGWRMLMFR
jgi:hypothetical protein